MEIQRGFLYYEAFLCGGRVWKEGGVHLDSNVRGHVRTYVRTYVSTYERTVRTYLYATFKYVYVRASPYVVHVRPYRKKEKTNVPGGPGLGTGLGPGWCLCLPVHSCERTSGQTFLVKMGATSCG